MTRLQMATETTYTSLRENLASVLDQVVDQQETVIVRRRGSPDVALVPAAELAGLWRPLTSSDRHGTHAGC
jgi:antitoxin YefM